VGSRHSEKSSELQVEMSSRSRNHRLSGTLKDTRSNAISVGASNPKALVQCGSQAEPMASLRNRRGAKYLIYLMAG
jgi:hypothetical protein